MVSTPPDLEVRISPLNKENITVIIYCTNGRVFTHNGNTTLSDYDIQKGIIHSILDVLEDKLLIFRNNNHKEYVFADNIDLKNNKYHMGVTASIYGKEIELISFRCKALSPTDLFTGLFIYKYQHQDINTIQDQS